ncbi:MAG: aspartate--tRNA ligase [Gemmatimonadetes bacterium]|nr:aspartate--tRNA ligase [Gemmatimonadota bacterium]
MSTSETSYRTHTVGEVGEGVEGREVTLAGWVDRRRDHGGILFLDLRDRYGLAQVVCDPAAMPPSAMLAAQRLRSEDVVRVTGRVRRRPPAMVNASLPSGTVEVGATTLELLAGADTPPFPVSTSGGESEAAEDLRLVHRYLDLRRPALQRNLLLRHAALQEVRRYLSGEGFAEIETPILTKPTPEGARDYLVPSRVHPGSFYALPQSPQLYKQILMVAGFDRYFQIARCFRDEDLRADRQPEFTQIDIEMSFADQPDVWRVTEGLFAHVWRQVASIEIELPFPAVTYDEAMSRFGTDKPDLRFGLELADVTGAFRGTGFRVVASALDRADGLGVVKALRVPGAGSTSRRELDELAEEAKLGGAQGLLWARAGDPAVSSAGKNLEPDRLQAALAAAAAEQGDLLLMVADERRVAERSLGRVRTALGERLGLADPTALRFLWVSDFPLFEPLEGGPGGAVSGVAPSHHPFTAPHPEDEAKLLSGEDLLSLRSRAYDVVLNGVELGSGSIRIHRPELQRRVFEVLGIGPAEAQAKFGFLLEALRYGAPPHGGIAPGFDRIVMLIAGAASLREVIAFPKTTQANALMEGAPAAAPQRELRQLHLRVDASPAAP